MVVANMLASAPRVLVEGIAIVLIALGAVLSPRGGRR